MISSFSAEARWFFRGETPNAVRTAFFTAGSGGEERFPVATREDPHTDVYLVPGGCDCAGVKHREGKLEVKMLRHSLGVAVLAPGVEGKVELWLRISAPVVSEETLDTHGKTTPHRVAVHKERWLRKYTPVGRDVQEIAVDDHPAEGCNAELTHIKALNGVWWSFGLEAFGPSDAMEGILRATATRLFRDLRIPWRFATTDSFSYPAWLSHFVAAE